TAVAGGPTIATAGLATAAGFLILLLSPVPMVRGFGALLLVGVVLALAATAGFAALVTREEADERSDMPPVLPRLRAALRRLGRRVSTSGQALAVLGRVDTVRDRIADLQALRDVSALQAETGIGGEIDVTVRAADVTDPAVLGWMGRFQEKVLEEAGFERAKRDSCLDRHDPPDLCPAFSLTDLFPAGRPPAPACQPAAGRRSDLLPAGRDHRRSQDRELAFGIRLQPLDRQREVVDNIKDELHPPSGVDAKVVGLPVLVAEANGRLSSPLRRLLTLVAALLAVFLVLWAVRRPRQAAFVPLIPIALARWWT
ncbi:MAG: hypothetical protein M3350_07705, partial [Actinomycetota bacterium]|nr:hypothetical protein [Actinomycetota bacterium]